MPGTPATFTKKTVILLGGKSGTGKSTLANFLKNEKVRHFNLDSLFDLEFLNSSECIYKKPLCDLLRCGKYQPTYYHINKYTECINNKILLKSLSTCAITEINKIFKNEPDVLLIIAEGYVLTFPIIKKFILDLIKISDYNCWCMSHMSDPRIF